MDHKRFRMHVCGYILFHGLVVQSVSMENLQKKIIFPKLMKMLKYIVLNVFTYGNLCEIFLNHLEHNFIHQLLN